MARPYRGRRACGKHLAVVAFGNFWGDQAFPTKTVRIVSTYGAVPLLFWSPWDKPHAIRCRMRNKQAFISLYFKSSARLNASSISACEKPTALAADKT